jgi:tetratricopeptide (TPR) repeat protein
MAVDIAYAETELARSHLLAGEPDDALRLAQAALGRLSNDGLVQRASALMVVGHALRQLGHGEEAHSAYRHASEHLTRVGAHRQAAAAWRELAEALVESGQPDEALAAYRHAADAMGVRAPASGSQQASHAAARGT